MPFHTSILPRRLDAYGKTWPAAVDYDNMGLHTDKHAPFYAPSRPF